MPHQNVVLITGASSGVGQATARLLAQPGYTVFGTGRTPAAADFGCTHRMLRVAQSALNLGSTAHQSPHRSRRVRDEQIDQGAARLPALLSESHRARIAIK